jgi:hypothetical protein
MNTMSNKKINPPQPRLDARKFQCPLGELTNTIAFKVQREGHNHLPKPIFVIPDIYYLLRQAFQTYNLFCFMNAEERIKKDVDYRPAYSAAILPLVRTMIDCLYNITAILKSPGKKGYQFRESGLKQILNALDADEQRYGGDPRWDEWIVKHREHLDLEMRRTGITHADVKSASLWPTLGAYLRQKDAAIAVHQQFLRKLTYGFWQEYSGISHATFQGLLPIAVFFAPNDLPHELRPIIDSRVEDLVSIHVPRVAAILLCTLTELQAYFKFDGARINERLHKIWDALLVVPEIKELYVERYARLMRDKGINP